MVILVSDMNTGFLLFKRLLEFHLKIFLGIFCNIRLQQIILVKWQKKHLLFINYETNLDCLGRGHHDTEDGPIQRTEKQWLETRASQLWV